jgi:hypothetical protein
MQFLKVLFAGLMLGLFACNSVAPTPILMGRTASLNTEVNQLYIECSEGANFVPQLPTCNSTLLEVKVAELLDLSKELIRADIKQPQGYDIYLATSLIHFQVLQRLHFTEALRIENDYSRAEMISRQFFEMQKASSRGKAINTARYYWAHYTSAYAAWQSFNDPLALNTTRKGELLSALAEGTQALSHIEGPRLIRLKQALRILEVLATSAVI